MADELSGAACLALIGEAVESWSYLKFPYYKPLGYPDGIYRVGAADPAQRRVELRYAAR